MLRIFTCFIGICLAASAAETYCDAPSEVQAELRRAASFWDAGLTGPKLVEARRAVLEPLAKRFPNDIQANRRYQNDSGVPTAELTAAYRKRLDANPGDALSIYFYALMLAKTDAPAGVRLFQEALVKDPNMAWPHIGLAFYYASGPLADKTKATQEVDAFFTKCPTSYDFYTNRMLGSHGSPALRKKVTAALRERVDAEPDPEKFGIFEHLWALEFKAMPPAEHPALRARVASDLRRIRAAVPQPSVAMMRMIRDGMKISGNAEGAQAIDNELLARFPTSSDAPRIAQQRWQKDHPFPGPEATLEQHLAWAQLEYDKSGEWVVQWPKDAFARMQHFTSAHMLKQLPATELKSATDGLLNLLKENEDAIYGFEPFEHQAAEEYLQRNIYVNLVPSLAEAGLTTVERRLARQKENAGNQPKEIQRMMQLPVLFARIKAIALLARASLIQKQAADASPLEARLAAIDPAEPQEKLAWLTAASYVAELRGHMLDAFAYQERALEQAPQPFNAIAKQSDALQRDRLHRLWTAAGGSDRTWAMRTDRKSNVVEAKSGTSWVKPEKAASAWQLVDITGRKWSSEQLAGKVVLANLWATWCGPCRAEHPHFQKLYEKLKDRTDVVVLSFNVDDQVGLVQGYLNEAKYTFPTLLAQDYVNKQLDVLSIPQNWLFDAKGVHRLTQEGFGASADWEAFMLKAIDSVLAK